MTSEYDRRIDEPYETAHPADQPEFSGDPLEVQPIEAEGNTKDYGTTEPYPLPDLRTPGKIEQETTLAVATVRDEQAQRIANMTADSRAHFLLNIDGNEVCGGCQQPFPCTAWRTEIDPRNAEASAGPDPVDVLHDAKVRNVMALLNVSREQAQRIVADSMPPDAVS